MPILAGRGANDITPPVGAPLAGRPRTYPTHRVHDPLQCRAIYLAQDALGIAIISIDLLLIERTECDPIRQKIANRLGMQLDAVILCCTHTHTGPGVGDWCPWDGREAYEKRLAEIILKTAAEARDAAISAQITYASAKRGDLSHNRRYVMANGRVLTHPPREGALHPDGPIDPEIQAVSIRTTDGHPIAVLVGFACHPTAMGWRDNAISADFPHWIEKAIQSAWQSDLPVLFIPGALGDQSDGDPFIRHRQAGPGLARRMGETIGREVLTALEKSPEPISGQLALTAADISAPTVDMGPARQIWAKDVLKQPDAREDTDVRDAKMILDMCADWPQSISTRIPMIAIGDLALYGIPGELFCWYGLQLKSQSRFAHAIPLGLANDRIGYIADRVFPTKDIFNQPLDFAHRTFGQTGDAGEILVQAALAL